MKTAYLTHIEQRAKDNLPPLVLNAQQTKSVVENNHCMKSSIFFQSCKILIGVVKRESLPDTEK
jgi:aconitase B